MTLKSNDQGRPPVTRKLRHLRLRSLGTLTYNWPGSSDRTALTMWQAGACTSRTLL
jgi:hypothetical protein